jgi:hypothetical protein
MATRYRLYCSRTCLTQQSVFWKEAAEYDGTTVSRLLRTQVSCMACGISLRSIEFNSLIVAVNK